MAAVHNSSFSSMKNDFLTGRWTSFFPNCQSQFTDRKHVGLHVSYRRIALMPYRRVSRTTERDELTATARHLDPGEALRLPATLTVNHPGREYRGRKELQRVRHMPLLEPAVRQMWRCTGRPVQDLTHAAERQRMHWREKAWIKWWAPLF
jgi:hypothetical protein